LPSVIDREKLPVKCLVKEKNKETLPSFINFNDKLNSFTIKPMNLEEINNYSIEADLVDPFDGRSTYFFMVSITAP